MGAYYKKNCYAFEMKEMSESITMARISGNIFH